MGPRVALTADRKGKVLEVVMGVGERAVRAPCWKGSGDEWELAKEGVGADSAAADQKDEERKVWAWRGGSWVGTLKSDFIVVVGLKTNAEGWWVRENIVDTEAVTCPLKETTVGVASVQHDPGTLACGRDTREKGSKHDRP